MTSFRLKTEDVFRAFIGDESGATAIEYALIASGISVAIIVGFTNMATSMKAMFNSIAANVVTAIT